MTFKITNATGQSWKIEASSLENAILIFVNRFVSVRVGSAMINDSGKRAVVITVTSDDLPESKDRSFRIEEV